MKSLRIALRLAAAAVLTLVIPYASAQTPSSCYTAVGCVVTTQPERAAIMATGWADSGTMWGSPAQFYRDVDGRCHFSGLIYFYSASQGSAIVLPDDCNPDKTYWFSVLVETSSSGPKTAQVIVRPAPVGPQGFVFGDIYVIAPADASWVSLSGISFRAK